MGHLQVIDSHTGGEPTRTVVAGGPELLAATMTGRREELKRAHDWIRTSLVCEPRGSEVMVGAYLCPPVHADSVAGVVFFNNVDYLNMCGHGLIGVVTTLHHLGRLQTGLHRLDTPAGTVTAELLADGRVAFENVPCYRHRSDVPLELACGERIRGDIAWGGNWFFLVGEHSQVVDPEHISDLLLYARDIRKSLDTQGITGRDNGLIDHIELFSEVTDGSADARSFVLCPGGEYDRSPCGTGTSAKVACLAEDGKLAEGATWKQQSVVGTLFEASYRRCDGQIIPRIVGQAFVNGETRVLYDPQDPFRHGLPALSSR